MSAKQIVENARANKVNPWGDDSGKEETTSTSTSTTPSTVPVPVPVPAPVPSTNSNSWGFDLSQDNILTMNAILRFEQLGTITCPPEISIGWTGYPQQKSNTTIDPKLRGKFKDEADRNFYIANGYLFFQRYTNRSDYLGNNSDYLGNNVNNTFGTFANLLNGSNLDALASKL